MINLQMTIVSSSEHHDYGSFTQGSSSKKIFNYFILKTPQPILQNSSVRGVDTDTLSQWIISDINLC